MGKERTKKDRIRSTPLLGGTLQNASADHAYERIRHCFLFCFYVEITCDYLNTLYGTTHDPATVIADSATHQIDEGYKNLKADEFDKSSSAPQDLSITGYSKMDAAHFLTAHSSARWPSTPRQTRWWRASRSTARPPAGTRD